MGIPIGGVCAKLSSVPSRVHVVGSPSVLDAVRSALPEFEVAEMSGPATELLAESECLLVSDEDERAAELLASARGGLVQLSGMSGPPEPVLLFGSIPAASVHNPREIRLAVRSALSLSRSEQLMNELTGPFAHDARGALGVARLALKLLDPELLPASPARKVDNGVTRLGFLVERLPSQIALALDLPLPSSPSPSLFPNLLSYVTHLRSIHPQRAIESSGDEWMARSSSEGLVPFAAGLTEFALKISAARATLRISMDRADRLEFACECPDRRAPWDIRATIGAAALAQRGSKPVPFRLLEAARLAIRSNIQLTVELTDNGFTGRVDRATSAL